MMKVQPVVLADPAFMRCLYEAAQNTELVSNFDRLLGTNLARRGTALDLAIDKASGRIDESVSLFVDFVYDAIYKRLDAVAVLELSRPVSRHE